jgi:NAD(P)-dependent dehydrogenase (short-subunit alcohol dehydrogenase family)
MFRWDNRVAVVTGRGVLMDLASSPAAAIGRRRRSWRDAADERAIQRKAMTPSQSLPMSQTRQSEGGVRRRLRRWRVDILVNAAGGNVPAARNDRVPIFDVPMEAFDEVVRLNLHGTVGPTMAFGRAMAERGSGSIVNLSSMAASRAITGAMGYGVAKAAIDGFTRWMAMDLARRYGSGLRVNAVAPGFFIGNQNRALLVNPDGTNTERGKTIIARTPMGRFGRAEELIGPVHWLCSDAASFVTGTVIPVDGGFSAFSGV